VNRRIAAHKNRKGISGAEPDASEELQQMSNSRAAAAAARVAARYAKVPSFSEMQAAEARVALRAAEATTRAAMEAQAAAKAVLEQIETNAAESGDLDCDLRYARNRNQDPHSHDPKQQTRTPASEAVEIRWEADLPVRQAEPQISGTSSHSLNVEEDLYGVNDTRNHYEAVEAAQFIPANLIEFPREIVATRRMRPRAEMGSNPESQQLSIFEVDLNAVSTEPMSSQEAAGDEPMWIGSSWSEIELDEQHPLPEYYALPAASGPKL
jgi:hypothetical protein